MRPEPWVAAAEAWPSVARPGGASGQHIWVLGAGGLLCVLAVALVSADPKLGLAVVGVALLPVLIAAPFAGFLLLVALVPFDAVASLGLPGTLTATRALGVVVMGCWLVSRLARGEVRLPGLPGWLLLLWVAFAATSVLWADDRERTRAALWSVLQLLGLYLVAVDVIDTRRRLEVVLDVLLLSTTAVALLVVWQLPSVEAIERATLRFGAQVFDPNQLAAALVLPAGAALALGRGTGFLGRWRLVALAPIGLAVVLTGSRGGLLALVAAVAMLAVTRPRRSLRLAVLVVAGSLLLAPLAPRGALQQMSRRYATALTDRGAGRLDIWSVGLAMVEDRPLRGIGFANFPHAFYRYMRNTEVDPRWARDVRNRYGGRTAHSIYVCALAELGLLGAALLLAALAAHVAVLGRTVHRAKRSGRAPDEGAALAAAAMLVALLVLGATLDIVLLKLSWIALALAQAAALALEPAGAGGEHRR